MPPYVKRRHIKTCEVCGKVYQGLKFSKYCDSSCRSRRNKKYKELPNLYPFGDLGAMAELIVALDLFKKGFEVYRALSGQASSDLVILYKCKLYKTIQVKSNRCGKKPTHQNFQHCSDILALVDYNHNITYYPPIN